MILSPFSWWFSSAFLHRTLQGAASLLARKQLLQHPSCKLSVTRPDTGIDSTLVPPIFFPGCLVVPGLRWYQLVTVEALGVP